MAIEVIRRGRLPENDQFDGSCFKCKTEVRFLRKDAKFTDDQRDGAYVTVSCPVCGDAIHVAASKGHAPIPPCED